MVETLILLLVVWLGWIHVVWTTNYIHLGTMRVRLMLLGLMLAGLVMSASLPEAFGDRGLTFAFAAVALILLSSAFFLFAIGRDHRLSRIIERAAIWWTAVCALLVAGALVDGDARLAIWLAAVALAYTVMWVGFPVPRLGRSVTGDYTILGDLFTHRCYLFITIALGESILVTGSSFGALPGSFGTMAAFVVAFVGSVALWWIYFHHGQEIVRAMAAAEDPGRLALRGYTYFHIPMIVGIIALAAADELALAHPGEDATAEIAAIILGGAAIYLTGTILFRRSVQGRVMPARVAGVVALCALVPVAFVASTLVLLLAANAVPGEAASSTCRVYARSSRWPRATPSSGRRPRGRPPGEVSWARPGFDVPRLRRRSRIAQIQLTRSAVVASMGSAPWWVASTPSPSGLPV
jgi:low temperature requirement protein LtrA